MGNSEYNLITFLFKNPDLAAVLGVFALILTIAGYFSNKKRANVEETLLGSFGLNKEVSLIKYNNPIIDMPSRGTSIFKDLILSHKDPSLYIFTKTNLPDKYSSAPVTKVFSFSSRNKAIYPSFTLRPEGTFGKYKQDIKYDAHPLFSESFYLVPLGNRENHKRVYKLFDDKSLHDYLLSEMITLLTQPINIESNGKQVFYYWDGFDFVLERFPEVLCVLERFHEKYFNTE